MSVREKMNPVLNLVPKSRTSTLFLLRNCWPICIAQWHPTTRS